MNCLSSGRDVSNRCKSVPRSSVTKYLKKDRYHLVTAIQLPNSGEKNPLVRSTIIKVTYMSSKGEIKMSLKLMIYMRKETGQNDHIIEYCRLRTHYKFIFM
jgi:hypothetical protein